MTKRKRILKKIIEVVGNTAPNSEIYLYGSRARGDDQKFSDWDLLILLTATSISFDFETKFMDKFYEIELETGEVISPLIYTKKDWVKNHKVTPLYENIQAQGIRIK